MRASSAQLAVVPGSIGQIAKSSNVSLAEAFLGANTIVLIDISGSMAATDSRGGKTRYDVACEELRNIQASHPGQVAVIAFSCDVQFCPGGTPPPYCISSTNLADALVFARTADVPSIRFIVISDGVPDSERAALAEAKKFKARIDTVFVGPEGDVEGGRAFLQRLAQASGGTPVTADRVMELASKVNQLLLGA